MGVGEVVGGVALVGLAVLIGLAITDNDEPDTLTETESTIVDSAATTTAAATTTSVETTAPEVTSDPTTAATNDTSEPDSTPSESTSDSSTTSSSTSSTTSLTAPSTTAGTSTTLSIDQRAAINVKVLNGGANTGAAGDVTAAVRYAGFTAQGPADASPQVGATTVLYGPGQQGAATAVNAFVGALPANVVEGGPADANWARYASTVDVLVVLGPRPG